MKLMQFLVLLVISTIVNGQDSIIVLSPISISENRIDIPFSQESRSVSIISNEVINNLPITSIDDLFQSISGIDIRRRGLNGSQSDIYIRGGTFEQTLILIDGFKMDDPQTGHHLMNLPVTLQNVERVEVIKGAAARVYGQNAFGGVINIITKTPKYDKLVTNFSHGSFGSDNFGINTGIVGKKAKQQISFSLMNSDGYKYNTDYNNHYFMYKINGDYNFGRLDFIASFSDRKFGANGFYASPNYIQQYEETRTTLLGISYKKSWKNIIIKAKIYSRNNLDNYYFLRDNPDFFHNIHSNRKIIEELNISKISNFGITGFGIESNSIKLTSNNLGNRARQIYTGFLEHRFSIESLGLDFTPGFLFANYSDIGNQFFPGIDIGYTPRRGIKIYTSFGQTFRAPSYTELYYSSPTTSGNDNLDIESAINGEIGLKLSTSKINFTSIVYVRKSDNLIDYFKDDETSKWVAMNQNQILSKGVEVDFSWNPKIKWISSFRFGYNYTNNDIATKSISRYSLNNLRHQLNVSIALIEFGKLKQSINYKYFDRVNYKKYGLLDIEIAMNFEKTKIFLILNNLLNENYYETNLIEMPGRYTKIGIKHIVSKN